MLLCAFLTCSTPTGFVLSTSKSDSVHAFLVAVSFAASVYTMACSYYFLALQVQKEKILIPPPAPGTGTLIRERSNSNAGPSTYKFHFFGIRLLVPNTPALEPCAFSVAVLNLVFLVLCGFIFTLWPTEFSTTLSYLLSLILTVICIVAFAEKLAPLHSICQLKFKSPKTG